MEENNQNLNPTQPVSQDIQTPSSTPPVSNIAKPKPKFPLVLIIGIILFLFIAGSAVGFYVFKQQSLKAVKPKPTPIVQKQSPTLTNTPTLTVFPTATSTPITTPTPDPIADWKTYNSTKGGFSIKYPGSWPLVNVPLPNALLDDIVFSPDYKANSQITDIAFITAAKQGGYPTLNEYLNSLKQDSSIADIKETSIGGERAVSYRRIGGIGTLPIIEYAVFKNGVMYNLVLEDSLETNKNREVNITVFNQILSIFKFTN